jgi:uncharacterized protein (TIGR02453 family)
VSFTGFPPEAFDFYDDLAANNSKSWWIAHKATYDAAVRGPMVDLLDELAEEFGRAHVFRPFRDVRFAKDKTPYKDHQGGFVGVEDAIGYYVQVSAAGLLLAGGWYSPQGQQIDRYRGVVDGPAGGDLERLLAGYARKPYELDGRPLKTHPRGWPPDHPRIELLRMRGLTLSRTYSPAGWMGTHETVARVGKDWRAVRPLVEWLGDHVGPADQPREPDQ